MASRRSGPSDLDTERSVTQRAGPGYPVRPDVPAQAEKAGTPATGPAWSSSMTPAAGCRRSTSLISAARQASAAPVAACARGVTISAPAPASAAASPSGRMPRSSTGTGTTVKDTEDLPVPDGYFDAVLSVFGAMFAPDHQLAADEIVRATRTGGTVGLASWTPDGFIGQMFNVITRHAPGPAGVASPLLWGTQQHLSDLFGAVVADARSVQRTCTWRFTSPDEFVWFFRRWYGQALKAFEVLDQDGRAALAHDLAQLARHWDQNHGGSIAIPATYLETILTLH